MGLEFKEKDGVLVIKIDGKLDSLNAKEVYEAVLERLKETDKSVVFDFEDLEYISSAGLQVIIATVKDRKAINKDVSIYKPNGMVDNVLNIAGFYSFLKKAKDV
ncbi:STAS domain-containing protein [Hippea sp. KM1]|uniref:STAS domain-containing protein n=1 Tax=Hippea sp. KM1 TaxID=944481 RepID=UPI00046CC217|nr:STAS domain-containing protein [Hippea sp. KM1]